MRGYALLKAKADMEDGVHVLFMGDELEDCRFIAAMHFEDVDSWVNGVGMTEADVTLVTFQETDFDRQVKAKIMEILDLS